MQKPTYDSLRIYVEFPKISTHKNVCRKTKIIKDSNYFYCILVTFDVKVHDSNEIYTFTFLLFCCCLHLEQIDQRNFLRNLKFAK